MPTPVKINNPDDGALKVLLAPLDWGLGHATRCIPIIKELLNQRCVVVIAASGARRTLLRDEFPSLTFVEIPGYEIIYGKNRALTIFRLIFSIPKILIRIKQENVWLRDWCSRERPDLVISDNRYGLHAPGIFSVFITHQLLIRTPFGKFADRWLQRMNYSAISRHSCCWIPDVEQEAASLAGELSHPDRKPVIPLRYIGWLSRLGAGVPEGAGEYEGSIDLLVLLSGPEPQRTLLEKMISDQAADVDIRLVIVRGLPGGGQRLAVPPGVAVYDHLPAAALEGLIRKAGLVLCRSGYSTVMDLMRLAKKAILIPTPGQTEQEYLGDYLASKGWAVTIGQSGFSLADALDIVRDKQFRFPGATTGDQLLQKEVRDVLALVGEGVQS